MDIIHLPNRRAWIDKKFINVKEFLESWDTPSSIEFWDEINSFENTVSKHQLYESKHVCRPDNLKYDTKNRLKVDPQDLVEIPKGVHLETLKFQKKELQLREKDAKYNTAFQAQLKFSSFPPAKRRKIEVKGKGSNKFKPVEEPDVVLTVQIHAPERRLDAKVVNYMKMPAFHVEQEFLVLGSQYLTELRDMIDCVSDNAVPGDYSDHPHIIPTITYKDIYKSGFLYINKVFYNDMRDKDCRDYSEPILKWSESRPEIGPFTKALMEETRFVDLTIQLGYPYLYVHQGDCEHLVIFTDLRLFSKSDEINRFSYPLYTQVNPTKRIFCMVCHEYTAVWVVYGSNRVPENPYFFCKSCFFAFNYDENDQKIGEFKAYHYPDRTRLF